MRSWPSLALLLALGCGNDHALPDGDDDDPPADRCETSYLTYDNFGAPFTLDWCRGCHSAGLPQNMRQHAPVGVDFDTHEDIMSWRQQIVKKATGAAPTMPPAGGPSDEERKLLAEWIDCGGR